MNEPRIYVITLNWNSWECTISCLESLLRTNYNNYCVVVCDNGSTNGSEVHILDWAEGRTLAPTPTAQALCDLVTPPIPKPIPITRYSREQAEAGGSSEDGQLVLVQTGGNLGFAGGCNVGIRYALARGDADYIWLLNNDTLVTPQSLPHIVARAEADPNIGMCGSTLLGVKQPNKIQALAGASLRASTGTSRHIGNGETWPKLDLDPQGVEAEMDYVVGASILASRRFLETIGLLAEDYFLYYEEIDWACRAKDRFRLAYASDSIVYHMEGGSSGFSLILYYYYRSMIRFTWRHRRLYLPFVVARLMLRFGSALMRRDCEELSFFIGSRFLMRNPLSYTHIKSAGKPQELRDGDVRHN